MSSLASGQSSPAFELIGLDGARQSLKAALERGPLLAVFFKVSCPTCQYTLPFVERLYEQFRDKGIQVIAIAQDTARDSQDFAREYGVTFPILIDEHPYEVSREYQLEYVPTLFWIGADGKIKLVSEGFSKADLSTIHKLFADHFSLQPSPLFRPNEKVPEYKPG